MIVSFKMHKYTAVKEEKVEEIVEDSIEISHVIIGIELAFLSVMSHDRGPHSHGYKDT